MASLSFSTLLFLSFHFLLLSSPPPVYGRDGDKFTNSRETLEIIIGGGRSPYPPPEDGDCPPPPPLPPTPKPSPIVKTPPSPLPPSPPPPPPPKPKTPSPTPRKASPFENERLKKAFFVIQKFAKTIEGGRTDIRDSWKGYDVCNYTGFFCNVFPNSKERALSGVSFNGYKFSGSKLFLKGLVDELEDIAFFHANSNFFMGDIPPKLLSIFYELDLSNNNLPGVFPNQVLYSKQLTFLDIRFNNYCGPIPGQLFDLDIITAIFINNNKFTSCIPDNLGKTPAKYLTFASNEFTGKIPRSIGQAKKTMEEIVFLNNKLDGCLPFEIGYLEKATLFDAGNNLLTGPIPFSFACLANMELLYLADNQFYGTVPEIVCKLPKLGNFTLRNNFFTQVGPECRKLIEKKVLDVSKNCIIDLPNQKSKAECESFFNKPKYCGNDMSFKYIHCKNNWYLHPYVSNPSHENVTKIVHPKKAYAVLTPDGRI